MAFWLCNPRSPQLRRSPRLRESRKASPHKDIATRLGFGDGCWTLGRQAAFHAARLAAVAFGRRGGGVCAAAAAASTNTLNMLRSLRPALDRYRTC